MADWLHRVGSALFGVIGSSPEGFPELDLWNSDIFEISMETLKNRSKRSAKSGGASFFGSRNSCIHWF